VLPLAVVCGLGTVPLSLFTSLQITPVERAGLSGIKFNETKQLLAAISLQEPSAALILFFMHLKRHHNSANF